MRQASITIIVTENETGETDITKYLIGISPEMAFNVLHRVALALDRERIRAEVEAERGEADNEPTD